MKRNDTNVLRLVGGIFSVVGIGLLLGGFAFWQAQTRFVRSSAQAVGTVTDFVKQRDSRNRATYAPQVRFVTSDGQKHEFTSTVSSNPRGFEVGDKVTVLYDPAAPNTAQINTFLQLWFGPVLLAGMGFVFSTVGGGLLWGSSRQPMRYKQTF